MFARFLIGFVFVLCFAVRSDGQEALELDNSLIELSEQVIRAGEVQVDATARELTDKQRVQRLIMNRFLDRNHLDVTELIEEAESVGLENLDIVRAYAAIEQLSVDEAKQGDDLQYLEDVQFEAKDWHREYLKNILLASFFTYQADINESIAYSQVALKSVPVNNNGLDELDALYDVYDIFQIQYILDRNVAKAMESTEKLIDYGVRNGRQIDTFTILGNLSYLVLQFENKEAALEISKKLVEQAQDREPQQQSKAYRYLGRAFYAMGELEPAVAAFTKSNNLNSDDRSSSNLLVRLALAEAEMGNIESAKLHLTQYRELQSGQSSLSDILYPFALKAEAEIMLAEGQYEEAFAALEEWSKYRVSELESLSHDDRRSMMSTLADSESELENAQLTLQVSQERAKQARTFLFASLLFATILIIWVFWLLRVKKTLAISRDKALAGEKAKSQFLAVMSHEIRTPLNAIIPMAEMLQGLLKGSTNAKFASLIVSSGQNLMSMLDNILTVSNDNELKPVVNKKPIDIRKFAATIMKEFIPELNENGVSFKVGSQKAVPQFVPLDKDRLSRVLRNLIRNAVKFTNHGSVDLFVLTKEEAGKQKFGFRIVDSGVGMDVSKLDELVKPFTQDDMSFTRSYDGAGIGLYVCRKLIAAENGTLNITSELGHGTTVEIFFDLEEANEDVSDIEFAA